MIPNCLRLLVLGNCGVLFLFIGLLLTGCRKDSPAEPETPKGVFIDKIAFTTWHESRNQPPMITVADLYDDSDTFRLYNRKELTEGLGTSLSKDRSWIAYILVRNNIRPNRINIDGTGQRTIPFPDDLVVQGLSISPKDNLIAVEFHSITGLSDGINIGVISSEGGNPRIVYADKSRSNSTDWSLDGKTIYFGWSDWNNRFGQNVPGSIRVKSYIVAVNIDGTNWWPVSDTLNGLSDDYFPAVSSDGKQIVFSSLRNHPDNIFPEIFVMDIDGNNVRQLTSAIISPRHEDHFDYYTYDKDPLWTNAGNQIIFQRDVWTYDHTIRRYKFVQDLYIINSDGTGLQNLTKDGESALPKPAEH